MARNYSWWWRPVDAETGEPLTKGKVFGSKKAAEEGVLFAQGTVRYSTQEYQPKGGGEWRRYIVKRVKMGA